MVSQKTSRKTNRFFTIVPLIAVLAICLFLTQVALAATVNIDLSTTRQTIRGFGGMNFPRWIGTLTSAQVDAAFGNGSGQIGMTIMRIDIPPNSGDWSGEVSAAARAINNHGAIVFASPWSPPASMKTNGSLIGGELKTGSYDDYADHLTDFANYMSSNGVSLYAVSLQNEPDISVSYESCDWTSTQMINFLVNNASVIPTRVMVAESYQFFQSFTDPILNNSSAEAQLEIIAGHIYGGGVADYPLAHSKGKEVWMTEHYTDSSNDADLWPNALNVGKEIHDCMAVNMNAYIWWYIRRSYGPIAEDGHVTKRGYCMSHFAKFVRPGYIRVSATPNPQSGVYVTAYKSGDTLVIVAVNQNSSSQSVTFSPSGGSVTSYTKYETSSSNSLSNMGSVGSTDTLAANSINTFVGTIGAVDTTPPSPDPMTWSSYPEATGQTTITMTATTATDADSPPVEYYFGCTNEPMKSSGWQSSTTYVATGLDPGTMYTFWVRAQDSAATPNKTGWSSTQSATTDPPVQDTTPPTPDPMTWSSYPTATGQTTITMTATTATDSESPPVEYYFECTNDGGKSSSWQSSTTYVATGLDAGTMYSFRVRARDSAATPNVTGWSSTQSATTDAPDTTPPTPSPMTWSSVPAATGASTITMTATTATDTESPPVRYLFECTNDGSKSSGWQTDTTYVASDLTPNTLYSFRVRARDSAAMPNETLWSSTESATTDPPSSDVELITQWGTGLSHDPNTGTDRALIFIAHAEHSSAVDLTSVTYGGQSMTPVTEKIVSSGDPAYYAYVAAYMLDEAGITAASDGSFVPAWNTTPDDVGYASVFLQNVDQNTPIGADANNSVTSSSTIMTDPLFTNDGDMVVVAATCGNTGNYTVNNDFSEAIEHDMDSSTGTDGYKPATGVSETPSVTHDNVNRQVLIGFVVRAATLSEYQNCAEVQAGGDGLESDLSGDCYVDYEDLDYISYYWLNTDCGSFDNCEGADFEPTDGIVDFFDFGDFAEQWLWCNDPEDSNCTPNW